MEGSGRIAAVAAVSLLLLLLLFLSTPQQASLFKAMAWSKDAPTIAATPEQSTSGGAAAPATGVCKSSDAAVSSPTPLRGVQSSEQMAAMMSACPAPQRLRVAPEMPFEQFHPMVFDALNLVVVGEKPLLYLLKRFKQLWLRHGGLRDGFYAEFGVFQGATLRAAHDAIIPLRATDVGPSAEAEHSFFRGPIAGFDSFVGLPSKWRAGFDAGAFATHYDQVRKSIPPRVELYRGWFQNTIGEFLLRHPTSPAALIHHDGDLFVSAMITFNLLQRRIVPGTFMCFDELFGYPRWAEHEMLALYLWMAETRAELCAIGVAAKVDGERRRVDIRGDLIPDEQSACFQVLALGGPPSP